MFGTRARRVSLFLLWVLASVGLFVGLDASPSAAQTTNVYVAGDIADCSGRSNSVANFLDANAGPFIAPGDIAYDSGTIAEFNQCYDPRFGVHKNRTYPAPGNHEYDTPDAAGYFQYFGSRAGNPGEGWYSTTINGWQVLSLNSNCFRVGGCGVGSPQYNWLQAQLNARPNACRVAFWHHPRFTSSASKPDFLGVNPLYQLLYNAGTDLVLQGHAHHYERFAPMNPQGAIDQARGIRTFVVGTGGAVQRGFDATPHLGSQKRQTGTFGVMELKLSPSSYSWSFKATNGPAINDTGSDTCHNAGGGGTPVAPSACTAQISANNANTALISWTRSANDNAAFYVVERSRNNGGWFWIGRRTSPATSINNSGLSNGSTYRYRVLSVSASGARTTARACSGALSPGGGGSPVAPASCVATRSGNSVTVSINRAANDNAAQFVIERSRNNGAWYWAGRINAPSTSFTNNGLSGSSSYAYRVKSRNSTLSSARLCNNGGGATSAVRVVSCWATQINGNQARVTWTRAANDNATSFVIYRQRNNGTWYWAARVGGNVTSWTNTGLGGGSYQYRIETLAGASRSASTSCGGNISV